MAVSRPIRVVHLIHGLGLGGLEQMVLRLAGAGRAHGVESSLVALGEDGPVRELARSAGLDVQLIQADGMSLPALLGIRAALAGASADFVHAHDLGPWLNAVAARALRPGTRVLATFHEQRSPSGQLRRAANVAARFSSALVACGAQVRREIAAWAPAGTRLEVIENGVPLNPPTPEDRARARAALQLPDDAIAIGYLGGLRPVKGPDRLLEAFLARAGEDSAVHLVFIGAGPLEAALRARAAGRTNVHFAGLVPDGARLLPGLDIYAQTSLSEGRSLSMLEAMAAGLPTVAHDLAPVREIHSHGTTALLAGVDDPGALAEALAVLARNPALRRRLGDAAQAAVRPWSLEAMATAYADLYRALADKTPRAHAA